MLSDYDGRNISEADRLTEELRIDDYSAGSYSCPSNRQNRDPILIKSYAINNSYVQDDISNANAVRGIAGWKNDAGWSMVVKIRRTSNFIILSEVHFGQIKWVSLEQEKRGPRITNSMSIAKVK